VPSDPCDVTWIYCNNKRNIYVAPFISHYPHIYFACFIFGQERMERTLVCCLVFICFLIPLTVADWNILNQKTQNGLKISLKNYCESWRMNVELHNIRDFQVVPEECTEYIAKYVKSTQYKVDSERTTEECLLYLSTSCNLKKDGKDAWIFDIDDTLLSAVPFYKNNLYD
jgi:hypothetical protein